MASLDLPSPRRWLTDRLHSERAYLLPDVTDHVVATLPTCNVAVATASGASGAVKRTRNLSPFLTVPGALVKLPPFFE